MLQFISLSWSSTLLQMLFTLTLLAVLACNESATRDVLAVMPIAQDYSSSPQNA
jgi:hypothetical protein